MSDDDNWKGGMESGVGEGYVENGRRREEVEAFVFQYEIPAIRYPYARMLYPRF
jgi:hypothetical protein